MSAPEIQWGVVTQRRLPDPVFRSSDHPQEYISHVDETAENDKQVNHLFLGKGVYVAPTDHRHIKAKKTETMIREFNSVNMPKHDINTHRYGPAGYDTPSKKYKRQDVLSTHISPAGTGQGLTIANKKTKY